MSVRVHNGLRVVAVGVVAALATTLGGQPPALAAPPDRSWMLPTQVDPSTPARSLPVRAASEVKTGTPYAPQPVRWPEGSAVAYLPSAHAAGTSGGAARVGALPVLVKPAQRATDTPSPASVRVEVLDRASTAAAGVTGVLMRVKRADGVATRGRAEVTVEYGGFRDAYGADWSSRLRLIALPTCALTTPGRAECRGTVLPSHNNAQSGLVSAEVDLSALASGTELRSADGQAESAVANGVLLALAAGPSSAGGDYGATSLQPSSTWSAGGSSGDFSWNYPMRVPPSLGGPAPNVALSYSSQSVDGRMAATNNQPSWAGDGFEYTPGFIERRYKPCADDMAGGALNTVETGDLCWGTENATLSLNGRSSELIKGADGKWHARSEDGSRIELRTGASNFDNNGEHWVVTTTDGTQYWFGLSRLPGWVSGNPTTSAAWTVRVYGNHAGEPCYVSTFANSYCDQAWRWNLDWVVDPRGNAMSLWHSRELNSYAANNTPSDAVSYVRGGRLTRIDYGLRGTSPFAQAPMRVEFAPADRCLASCLSGTVPIAANWPDTPWDQECAAAPCSISSPTFWNTKRLSTVTTRLWSGTGTTYNNVERWTLTHSFPAPGDQNQPGLWLAKIAHSGLVGGTTTVPDITFGGVQMANRVDGQEGIPAMNRWRIQTVKTESGNQITVEYTAKDCAPGNVPAEPHNNVRRCYPVRWTPETHTDPTTEYFHKYMVAKVSEEDPSGHTTRVVTRYEYQGDPAWHYTDDDGLIKAEDKTWSVWRGYGSVRTLVGDPGEQTATEARYFRGMHGDKQPSGTRTVVMPAVGAAPAINDEDEFAGMVRESITYNGPVGAEVSGQVSEPWRSDPPTATRTINGTTVNARFVNTGAAWKRTTLDGGRPALVTSTRSWFDAFGMVTQNEDYGDLAVAGDERCTLTTYVRNTTAWLMSYPSRVKQHSANCTVALSGALTEDHWISHTRTYYDQLAFSVAPLVGLVSKVDEMKGWNAAAQTTAFVSPLKAATHDAYGRILTSTDIRNNTTTNSYAHNTSGHLASTTATNHLGWVTTTTLQPAWGTPSSIVDPNGRRTDLTYDGLGRTTAVWLPGRDKAGGATASSTFGYALRNNAPTSVTTATLSANNTYVTSHALFDAMLRPLQTQAPEGASTGGRVVTDTIYDTAGRAKKAYGPRIVDGAPSSTRTVPGAENTIDTVNTTVFDGVGRATEAIFSSGGVEKWRTTTRYGGGDRIDVTPPAGGTATSTVVDARGRTKELRQYQGVTPVGAHDATVYTSNNKDELVRVTDPVGNDWDYTFDLRGRQVQADDPDKGRTTSTFNDAGDLLSTTDSRGEILAHTYDSIGRKTTVRDDTATGAKRQEWVYDTLTDGTTVHGQLIKSIRWDGANAYTTETLGFNTNYTPTASTVTIPASEADLAGTYQYNYSYLASGALNTTRLPDVDGAGGLGTETLTNTYNAIVGAPYELKTNYGGTTNTYVASTTYTRFGETAVTTLLNGPFTGVQIGRYYADGTRRLDRVWTTRETNPATISDQFYGYDNAGNIKKISDVTAGDFQCFTYDYLRRLREAWTPATDSCTGNPSLALLGGPAKYWSTWTFDKTGNRLTQDAYNPSGGNRVTTNYAYPAAGAAQPHTLSSTSGFTNGSYTYDTTGNTLTRPTASTGTQTLTWDAEGHVATSVDTSGTTRYIYDANGQRLVRRDPTGKTLYLPGQELRYTTSGNTKSTTRYYSHNGRVIGSRTPAGLSWLAGDHQGTAQHTVANTVGQPVTTRRQTPYGTPRGTVASWPNDKGFVGGTKDNTGLTHLGAREYDPHTGRFISVDPLIDHNDPQQMHGFAYANNTSITASDPDGLCVRLDDASAPCIGSRNYGERQASFEYHRADRSGTWGRRPPQLTLQPDWRKAKNALFPSRCSNGSDSRSGCGGPASWMDNAVAHANAAGIDPRILLSVLMAEVANSEGLGPIDMMAQWGQVLADKLGVDDAIMGLIGRVTGFKEGEAGGSPSIGWGNMQEEVFEQTKANNYEALKGVGWKDMIGDIDLAIKVSAYRIADAQKLAEGTASPATRHQWTPQEVAGGIYNVGDRNYLEAQSSTGSLGPQATTYATTMRVYQQQANRLICHSGVWACS